MTEQVQAEATGETVGEAKWNALQELERLHPQLDKESVQFQVVSEGQRGILGVGFQPARVRRGRPRRATRPRRRSTRADAAGLVRAVVERAAKALGVACRVDVHESDGRRSSSSAAAATSAS